MTKTKAQAMGILSRVKVMRALSDHEERTGEIPSHLAKRAGVSQGAVSKYVNGRQTIRVPQAIVLADAMGISLDHLLRGRTG